jgi:hypothetical protein
MESLEVEKKTMPHHMSDDCIETLNTLNSVIEDYDHPQIVEITENMNNVIVGGEITLTNNEKQKLNNNKSVGCDDCSSIIDMTNSAKSPKEIHANQPYDKMDPIDENTLHKLEPEIEIDKVEPETLETESLEGLSDSGIYSAARLSSEVIGLPTSFSNNISSIKAFRMSQRVKKEKFVRPTVTIPETWSADTLVNSSRVTTLRRNDNNRKREAQKESLREKNKANFKCTE